MRPVDSKFPTSQEFGSGATQGVDPYGNDPMAALVRQYGNYQPYGHAGEDIACPVGTPVRAMADGKVLWADWGTNLPGDESEWGYRQRWYLYKGFPGIVTVIQHPGWIGVYAHLSNNNAAPRGATVKEGQVIALSGDTGGVAPHLHREALVDLTYRTGGGLIYGRTDPAKYDRTITTQSATTKPLGLFMTLNAKEEQEILAAARLVRRYLDAPVSKVDEAVLDAKVTRAVVGGETTLRATLAHLDNNLNKVTDAAKPKP